jgi:hypothetical protein
MAKDLYTEPCPSPNGTNYERLYIIRKPALMAMDEAGPPPREDLSKSAWGSGDDIDDINETDNEGYSVCDKVRMLLEGKLDQADIDALCALIDPDSDTAPAQDRGRGRRQAHDSQRLVMPSRAEIMRRIAASGEVRAARVLKQHAALVARFPALKNARVA